LNGLRAVIGNVRTVTEERAVIEQVVLLDERGRSIGAADKATVHDRRTPLHLAFSCYVFDPAGRLLLSRRALTKRTWPGAWTNSCCGHPAPGEPIAAAVTRRSRDELGLPVPEVDLILPWFRYRAEMASGVVENELCPVFRAITVDLPRPRREEVDAVEWVAWPAFAEAVSGAERDVSPWCRLQVDELRALGPDPLAWPVADPAGLPPAAR
jgi:isopentenyl-diphosphate Delta-isomerase